MAAPSRQEQQQKPKKKDEQILRKKEDRGGPRYDVGTVKHGGVNLPPEPPNQHRAMLARLEGPAHAAEKTSLLTSLQQSYGNRYVQRLLAAPSDSRALSAKSPAIPAGGGSPLDRPVRNDMENRFGTSLSDVRVHTDAAAGDTARSLGARAFTTGQDMYFGQGAFQPHTPAGRSLLAHELTHTLQQRNTAPGPQRSVEVVPADDPLEQQAERAADAVARGPGFLEAYPRKAAAFNTAQQYHGPLSMYLAAGFEPVAETQRYTIVRKKL